MTSTGWWSVTIVVWILAATILGGVLFVKAGERNAIQQVEAGPFTYWTVDTAPHGKWLSCLHGKRSADATITVQCGSPMTFDEAAWWSQTQGGQKVKQQ